MLVLLLGVGSAKLVVLLLTPVLTRLYSPELFGLFSVATAIALIASPFCNLRYSVALPLVRDDDAAFSLLSFALFTTVIFSLIVAFGLTLWVFVFSDNLMKWEWWLIVFIVVFIVNESAVELLTSWNLRSKNFRRISTVNLLAAVVGESLKMVFAFTLLSKAGLLLGLLSSQVATVIGMARKTFSSDQIKHLKWSEMLIQAHKYIDFPKYRLPAQAFLILSSQLPVIFVASIFGASAAGNFGLANMALALPVSIVSQSLSQAFYAEIAVLGPAAADQIRKLSLYMLVRLSLLGVLPALVLWMFGEYLFKTLFGDEWLLAGQLASIMSVYLVAQFISTPLTYIYNVFDLQHRFLMLNLLRLIAVLLVGWFAILMRLSIDQALLLYASFLLGFYVYFSLDVFGFLNKKIQGNDRESWKD